jgi:hypothetical protein
MGNNVYRSTADRDARREWIRGEKPSGAAGWVFEDLDLIVRRFIPRKNERGWFRLVENKWDDNRPGTAQLMTFKLMDDVLKASPLRERYKGFWVVLWPSVLAGKCEHCGREHPRRIDFGRRPKIGLLGDESSMHEVSWEELSTFFDLDIPSERQAQQRLGRVLAEV